MRIVLAILYFAAAITMALVLFGMTVAAIKYGKFRYEKSGPPVIFNVQPVRFVLSCIVFALLGCVMLLGAALGAVYLYELL